MTKPPPVLKISGVPIKNPSDLKYNTYNLSDSGRLANGLLTLDIIARKATLDVAYDVLSGEDMDLIRSLIDNGAPFFQVEHLNNGRYEVYTMYAGAIHGTHFRRHMGWYWKDVTFALIEQ